MGFGEPEMKLFSNICAKQQQLNEQAEKHLALGSGTLLEDKNTYVEDEEEDFSNGKNRRPASPEDYNLAMDATAHKMLSSVIDQCKLFLTVSSQYKDESQELLTTLVGLHEILIIILDCPSLNRYQDVLEDIMLHSTMAYAFIERMCCRNRPNSSHGFRKVAMKMSKFACHFFNQTLRLCDIYETSDDDLRYFSPRKERPSFGVTTYHVPLQNVSERLLRKKRVQILLTEVEGKSSFNVELSYNRSWFSKDDAMVAKIESSDRGFSQTLQAGRVKLEKGSWGWEEAQDTVLITYDDFVLANVAAISGSLLSHNKISNPNSPKYYNSQQIKTSVQIVGSSRVDVDLQNLRIKGAKDKENVYYKCYINSSGREEVLGIYRCQQRPLQRAQGILHILGRGNQPGVRHVLVSIFSSLGFIPVP